MDKLSEVMEKRVGEYHARRDWRGVLMLLIVVALLLIAWIEYQQYQVMVRSHNLDTFYKILGCDDLPTNVEECELSVGKFMLPESGLFTR